MTEELPTPHCYRVDTGFLAGNYPRTRDTDSSREKFRRILDAGVTCFVDLTTPHDPLEPYDHLLSELADGAVIRAAPSTCTAGVASGAPVRLSAAGWCVTA